MKFVDLQKITRQLNKFNRLPNADTPMYCRNCRQIQLAYRPNEIIYAAKSSVCSICGWIYTRGSIDEKIKRSIFKIDAHECVYCASTTKLTVEHIKPAFYGGSDEPENLVTACRKCNYRRNNDTAHAPMLYGRFRQG